MLPKASVFSRDMPIGHPAELAAISDAFQRDQEGIEGHFLFLLPQPGLQLIRQECRDNFEGAVAIAQLEIQGDLEFAWFATGRTGFGS